VAEGARSSWGSCMVVAPQGCLVMSMDFCQMEARIFAHFAGCRELMAMMTPSADLFRDLAGRLFAVPTATATDQMVRAPAPQRLFVRVSEALTMLVLAARRPRSGSAPRTSSTTCCTAAAWAR
jgi:hypothetical protein